MKHFYVYRITNVVDNKHYYGYRTTKKDPVTDLGISYFSSSSNEEFIKDQKENPRKYKYKIIKIFDNKFDALNLEIKLHNKFEVGINESFYNKSKQTSNKFDTTGNKEIIYKVNKTLSKIGEDGLTSYQRCQLKRLDTVSKKYVKYVKIVPWSSKKYDFEPHIINDESYPHIIKPSLSVLNRIFRNIDKVITIQAYKQSIFLQTFGKEIIGKTYNEIGFKKLKKKGINDE